MAFLDLTGHRFGRLTVIGLSPRSSGKRTYWRCACDCGGETDPRADALRSKEGSGSSRSCGCLQKEKAAATGRASRKHDYCRTRIYDSWCHMIDRCYNPNNGRYADYGGRGVTICDRWRENFLNFLADMGEMPDGMTIERRDNDKPYSKENCVWADYTQQNRNRRNSIYVATEIGAFPLQEYADMKGLTYYKALRLVKSGAVSASRPFAESRP